MTGWERYAPLTGVVAVVLWVVGVVVSEAGAARPEDERAENILAWSTFGVVEVTLIPMLVAAGLVIVRHGALPRWLAWLSFLLALVLAIIPIGWAGLIFVFPIWVLATSVLLYLRSADEPVTTGPSAP